MNAERVPVIVGVGQLVQRDVDPREAPSPLDLLESVSRAAAEDAGAPARVWDVLDSVATLSFFAGRQRGAQANNPPRVLAERLGARPIREYTSEVGGQIGVTAANVLAERIARGESRAALLVGCNTLRTLARARSEGVELDWTVGGAGTPELLGVPKMGNSELEARYGMVSPPAIYPIFENALRARQGYDLEAHRRRMGRLFSPFTEVAAKNPYAWFPTVRSPEELTTVTSANRMIAFPYPKYLNAVLDTDQAAACLILSVAEARALGIAEDRWVYWWGGADAEEEAWWPSERPDFATCPSMLDATLGALQQAELEVGDIDHIDFYSCFPVAVEMACHMLGIDQDDPRGFSVTGGLPYAGGPGSAYTLHSLASMADVLRDAPGDRGLVTGNGWYLTKHASSIWSSAPKPGAAPTGELPESRPSQRFETAPAVVAQDASGPGTAEAYTVVYDRAGAPERGIVLGRLGDGRRFLANTPADRALLEDFVAQEEIGRQGTLSQVDDRTIFDPA